LVMNPTRNREGVLSREGDRRRSPLLTVCVLVATSAVSIVGFVYHGVLDALERAPGVLARDEWWRLLTPLLVHDGGWPHLAANAAALVVVGVSVERAFGRRLWLALYLAGGLAGELAGYAWQPRGAGNSVAVCGLAGGLLAALLLGREAKVSAIGAVFVPYWVAALVAYASDSLVVGVGLCALVAPLGFLIARNGLSRPLAVCLGSAELLGALTLLALHDIHGPALLAGALVGAGRLQRNPDGAAPVSAG
jgi:membrane associated rhomboid family serine protease